MRRLFGAGSDSWHPLRNEVRIAANIQRVSLPNKRKKGKDLFRQGTLLLLTAGGLISVRLLKKEVRKGAVLKPQQTF
jgi:hypothetical protein